MTFRNLTLERFLQTLSEPTPTPGGGTVAAIHLALATALLHMYSALSAQSKKVAEEDRQLCLNVQKSCHTWLEQALDLADWDANAFDKVMEAYRMPRETEDNKSIRKQAITEATLHAARVPLETAQLGLKLIQACHTLAGKGIATAVSDLESAYQTARTALLTALANVAINLTSLDEATGEPIRKEYQRLVHSWKEEPIILNQNTLP